MSLVKYCRVELPLVVVHWKAYCPDPPLNAVARFRLGCILPPPKLEGDSKHKS